MANTYRVPVDSQAAPWPRWANGKQVFKLPENAGWMVSSSRLDRGFWHVERGYEQASGWWFECGCEAGSGRGKMGTHATLAKPCAHVLAVASAEKAQNFADRSVGKVNPSVFMD